MPVEDTNKIDFISPDESIVILTIADSLEWGNPEHLYMLQEKLNTYLRFIESGELLEAYPEAKDKKLKIDVKLEHLPDKEGVEFLAKCTGVVMSAGYQFSYGEL